MDAGVLGRPDSVATAQPQDAYLLPAHSLGAQDTVAGAASAPAPEGWPSGLGLPFPAGPLDVIRYSQNSPCRGSKLVEPPGGKIQFSPGKEWKEGGVPPLKVPGSPSCV